MSKGLLPALLGILITSVSGTSPAAGPASAAASGRLAQARVQAERQNWKEARAHFEQALAAANDWTAPPAREAVQGSIGCAERLGYWDEAFVLATRFVERTRGRFEEAVGLRLLAGLHQRAPRDRKLRKFGLPALEAGGSSGENAGWSVDFRAAVARYEEARQVLERLADGPAARKDPAISSLLRAERIGVNFDLAAVLTRGLLDATQHHAAGPHYWWWEPEATNLAQLPPSDVSHDPRILGWRRGSVPVIAAGGPQIVPTPERYAPTDGDGRRVLFLLAEVERLDVSERREDAAISRLRRAYLARALYDVGPALREIEGEGDDSEPGAAGSANALPPVETLTETQSLVLVKDRPQVIELPPEENPLLLFREVARRYPRSRAALEAEVAEALYFRSRRQFDEAERLLRRFLERHPHDKQRAFVRNALAEMGRPEVVLQLPTGSLLPERAALAFTVRNAERVEFVAHRIDYAGWLLARSRAGDQTEVVASKWRPFRLGSAVRWVEPIAKRHLPRRGRTQPSLPAGTYVIEAQVPGNAGRTAIFLRLQTEALILKAAPGKLIAFLADARTGAPLAGREVQSAVWQKDAPGSRPQVTAHRSDAEGQVEIGVGERSGDDVLVFHRNADGATITARLDQAYRPGLRPEPPAAWRGSFLTDRPIYRPGQTVRFRLWLREVDGVRLAPPRSGQAVQVSLASGYGGQDDGGLELSGVTDEGGGLSGELVLPREAKLGGWRLELKGKQFEHIRGLFRVEEYRRPEFEVSVSVPTPEPKYDQKFKVRIEARFLHGAPVASGNVRVVVSRERYDLLASGWSIPNALRYPWLAWTQTTEPEAEPGGEKEPAPRWTEELTLGKDGSAELEIDPQKFGVQARFRYDYSIQAAVTDASRRVEQGTNQISLAQREYAARVEPERVWFEAPQSVRVNVYASPTSGRPQAFSGTVALLRLTYPDNQTNPPNEELVAETVASIPAAGEAAVALAVATPGQYRVRYVGKDGANHLIEANALFWVGGPGFEGRRLRFKDLELIADKPSYRPGETMRLLVASQRAGARVLLVDDLQEGLMRSWRFLELRERIEVLSLPIPAEASAERRLEALLVHDGQLFRASESVEVRRPESVLKVAVEADRASYLPGQEGTLRISVRDHDGRPVTGELAVAGWDDALRKFAQRHASVWSDLHERSERQSELTASSFGDSRERYRDRGRSVANEAIFDFFGAASWEGYWLPEAAGLRLVDGPTPGGSALAGYGARVRREILEQPWGAGPIREPVRVIVTGSYIATRGGGGPPEAKAPTEALRQLPSYVGNTVTENDSKGGPADEGSAPKAQPSFQAAQSRTDFSETALWLPRLQLDADGTARTPFRLPDALTRWEFWAVAIGSGNQVGEGQTKVVGAKRVLVRLHAPRFLVERDELTLSVSAHNYLDRPQLVRSELTLPRRSFELTARTAAADGEGAESFTLRAEATVAAGGEHRFDWPVRALETGSARIAAKALTSEESDALEIDLPIAPHAAIKQFAQVGSFRPKAEGTRALTFDLPTEIESAHTELVVELQPSLAKVLVETLPFLIEYPYGCVEQTMSRFYPAAVVAATLRRLGTSLEQLAGDPAQERRARQFAARGVYDTAEPRRIVLTGLARIGEMQRPTDGWGWWTGDDVSPLQTAYVVQGLLAVRETGYEVEETLLNGGRRVLERHLDEVAARSRTKSPRLGTEDAFVAYVYGLLQKPGKAPDGLAQALRRLQADRADLTHQGRALLALALQRAGRRTEAALVLRNLLQFLERDDANETAWIRSSAEGWWHWYRQDVETNAWTLRALLALEPRSDLAPRLVKWLVENRAGGTHWRSTRDTALALEAIAEYLRVSGEAAAEVVAQVRLDDGPMREIRVARGSPAAAGRLVWSGADLKPGRRTVTVQKSGAGALYFAARLKFRSREGEIAAAGGDLSVERRYFRIGSDAGGAVQRTPLQPGEALRSGEEIEAVLLLQAKNDYDFLAFEDLKPAGCEPVELVSGSTYAGGFCANVELRDDRVVFFLAELPRGERTLRYRLRAETPGVFRAPPAVGFAMYAPELRANSATDRLKISE